jgi:hypothetical protein
MKYQIRLAIFFSTILTFSSIALAADYGNYKGKGGMLAYQIQTNVYEYHFDKGFTGEDAAGWDPNLQYAWSRIAAAKICNIEVFQDKLLPLLIEKYGQDNFTHELVGINFHEAQIKTNSKFCTPERIEELKNVIPEFSEGKFPKKF